MITLIIPTTSKNQAYTNNLISNIRLLYPNEFEVEIIVEENDLVTLGQNYNNAVAKAASDKIILLHNDMILSPGFVETMDKHIQPGRITTYTRIEPPIYNDTYPGKVILDCGSDLATFNLDTFNSYQPNFELIDGGSQLFFGCMRNEYIGIDGNTFKMFCEDDDLHRRYKLNGFEHKVSSAYVYHFVSKTSRADNSYQEIEMQSNRNYIRKWGSRGNASKYNIALRVENCTMQLLETLEPWCDRIYSDAPWMKYVTLEQPKTSYDLTKRCHSLTDADRYDYDDIVVEIDASRFTNQDFTYVQQLAEILDSTDLLAEFNQPGEQFELGNLKITIQHIQTYEKDLIVYKK